MKHIVSVSGGKDSTATYLRALERGLPFRAVAADTGNEHPATYEAVNMLSVRTGGPVVEWVKADFSRQIAGKARFVAEKWPTDLVAGKPGRWEFRPSTNYKLAVREWLADKSRPKPSHAAEPALPQDVFLGRTAAVNVEGGRWVWRQGYAPLSPDEAAEVVHVALEWLKPTGNPYLDLCIWKGRFPSRRAQFCTEELKIFPIKQHVTGPLLAAGETVISWQGVRASESFSRSLLRPLSQLGGFEDMPGRLYAYRPLLRWTVEEVFAYAARFGIPPNMLYAVGCSRVGCFPCINSSKAEIALVDRVFPEQIDRLEWWEQIVSRCAKRGMSTFFNIVNDPVMAEEWGWSETLGDLLSISHETHGVREMVEWAKTDRGGRQFNLFPTESLVCSASMGACE